MIVLRKTREHPRVSVYLGVAGFFVQVISAVAIYLLPGQEGSLMWNLMGGGGMAAAYIIMGHSSINALLLTWAVTLTLLLATLFSIILMKKGTLNSVKIGSLLLIILALLSATTTFGLILGAVLMFMSSVAGIVWAYRRTPHL